MTLPGAVVLLALLVLALGSAVVLHRDRPDRLDSIAHPGAFPPPMPARPAPVVDEEYDLDSLDADDEDRLLCGCRRSECPGDEDDDRNYEAWTAESEADRTR